MPTPFFWLSVLTFLKKVSVKVVGRDLHYANVMQFIGNSSWNVTECDFSPYCFGTQCSQWWLVISNQGPAGLPQWAHTHAPICHLKGFTGLRSSTGCHPVKVMSQHWAQEHFCTTWLAIYIHIPISFAILKEPQTETFAWAYTMFDTKYDHRSFEFWPIPEELAEILVIQ